MVLTNGTKLIQIKRYTTPQTTYTKKLIEAVPEGKLDDIKMALAEKGITVN